MRSVRALGCALALLALQCTAPSAFAQPGREGGIEAPAGTAAAPAAVSARLTGGSEYGVVALAQRPVVTLLEVPAVITAGPPPPVIVRVDEAGTRTVHLRATITSLSTRGVVLIAEAGWVRVGRQLTIGWPAGSRLAPGGYHVSLAAYDHHAASLLRRAHASGVATLTVLAPQPPAPAPPEAGAPSPAATLADGAVFPVAGPHNFGGPENRFGAPRAGHIHEGQDVLTAEGTPVVAPLAGTIVTTSYQAGGAGYYAVEQTEIGLDFMFAHCRAESLAVSTGEAVRAGQTLCQAGQTGDATAPHLHFEIWVGAWQQGGHPIDPLPYLEAWER